MDKPSADMLEVSVFGPGYGECAVVHLGLGDWLVVDSCVHEETGLPVALQYLASIGVDPNDAVKLVIASHWHDDHIRGLARVVEAAGAATFVCSEATKAREFLAMVEQSARESLGGQRAVAEIGRIFDVLAQRARGRLPGGVQLRTASANKRVFRRIDGIPAEVWTLAPSEENVLQGKHELASLLDGYVQPSRAVPALRPNASSVVAWIEVGIAKVLLGGDLENAGHPGAWDEIASSGLRPSGSADILKVPHHGSPTAHSLELWEELLVDDCLAALTPWCRGGNYLPSPADVSRICGYTEHAYISSNVLRKVPPRPRAVQKTVSSLPGPPKSAEWRHGHVRFRRPLSAGGTSGPWEVDVFGSAAVLCAA